MSGPIQIIKKFWNFYDSNKDKEEIIVYGGSGGGKSHSICQRLVYDFFNNNDVHFLIVRKTSPSLKATTQRMILNIIDQWGFTEGKDYQYNRTDREITCKNGNLMRFTSVDDPAKLKSSSYNVAYCEEVTELTEEDYFFIKNTIRRPPSPTYKNKIIVSFNPISLHHWFWQKHVITINSEKSAVSHSVYKDNPFLPQAYRDQLEALVDQDENFYRVYCLGEPGVLEHNIYRNYCTAPYPNNIDRGDVVYGLDFGFNNPSALVECCTRDNATYIRERLYESRLTNGQLIDRMNAMNLDKSHPFYCDAAEPARIEELKEAGYNAIAADKSVKDGIDFVKRHRLHIDPDSSNILMEIPGYSYRKKGEQVLDEPVKFRDHGMDALRYALYTHSKQGASYDIPDNLISFGGVYMDDSRKDRYGY